MVLIGGSTRIPYVQKLIEDPDIFSDPTARQSLTFAAVDCAHSFFGIVFLILISRIAHKFHGSERFLFCDPRPLEATHFSTFFQFWEAKDYFGKEPCRSINADEALTLEPEVIT